MKSGHTGHLRMSLLTYMASITVRLTCLCRLDLTRKLNLLLLNMSKAAESKQVEQ